MNINWTEARALRTEAGRALAVEIAAAPENAFLLATGALEDMADVDELYGRPLDRAEVAGLLARFHRALAAAAMVADAASGLRAFTGAADFTVDGKVGRFIEPEQVGLGVIVLATLALNPAGWVVDAVERAGVRVPDGHRDHVALVHGSLGRRAGRRLSEQRAELMSTEGAATWR